MASKAVRSLIVVQRSGRRQTTRRAAVLHVADRLEEPTRTVDGIVRDMRRVLLALVAFVAFLAAASPHHVTQASAMDAQDEPGASAAHQLEHERPRSSCPQYRPGEDKSSECVLEALEPPDPQETEDDEDPEEDGDLGAAAVRLALKSVARLRQVGQVPRVGFAACVSRSLDSSARPRAPPSRER